MQTETGRTFCNSHVGTPGGLGYSFSPLLIYICTIAVKMKISKACIDVLDQLAKLVTDIQETDFTKPSEALSRSTIGQHLRHTLEFFVCFQQGFQNGIINYDKRLHDERIENDKYIALAEIHKIVSFIKNLTTNKDLMLEVGYDQALDDFVTVETNATRELVYNIEHAVHHMAIMKIGIRDIAPYIKLQPDFGVAASTIRFRETADRSDY